MTKLASHQISGKNLIYWLVATVCLMFALVLFIFIDGYQETTAKINNHKHDLINDDIRANIKYFDESMSMSARLFAFTGDKKWQIRYQDHAKQLEVVLNKAEQQSGQFFNNFLFEATELANKQIKSSESAIIANIESSESSTLLNENYLKSKQDYALRVRYFSTNPNNAIRLNQLQSQISYIDEILTMSARMAAFTGDSYWKAL